MSNAANKNFAAAVKTVCSKCTGITADGIKHVEARTVAKSWPRTTHAEFTAALKAASKDGLLTVVADGGSLWIVC